MSTQAKDQDAVAVLRAQLTERARWLAERQRMNATDVRYGHARLDAFGQIFNAAAVEFLNMPPKPAVTERTGQLPGTGRCAAS